MPEKKLKVYCETSFWSFLNGRPTPVQHVAVKQSATLKWWQEVAPLCEVYVSQQVNLESDGGDPEYAARRRKGFEGALRIDGMTPEIKELAATLLNAHAIPQTEPTDALHIATATVYGMDAVLTWNCKHMANPVALPKTVSTISKAGYECPVIITPMDFLDRKEEFGL